MSVRPIALLCCLSLLAATSFWMIRSETASADGKSKAPVAKQADIALATETLDYWQTELAGNPDWLDKNQTLRRKFGFGVASVDLDRAIALDANDNYSRNRTSLLLRLVAAHRWEDVVKVADRRKLGTDTSLHFWSLVAQYGAKLKDMNVVQLAGKQVERNAAYLPTPEGIAPRPRRSFLGARLFVAAARLEVLRELPDDSKSQYLVYQAGSDLWRLSGEFARPRSQFEFLSGDFSDWRKLAALEYWQVASPQYRIQSVSVNNKSWLNWGDDDNADDGIDSSLKPLLDVVDKKFSWPNTSDLPDLSESLVYPWISGHLHQGRSDVVITYLAIAAGGDLDRARLLATVAQHTKDAKQRQVCIDVANKILKASPAPSTNHEKCAQAEAYAELGLALHAADNSKAAETVQKALAHLAELEQGADKSLFATNAVLFAATKLKVPRDQFPAVLAARMDRLDQLGYVRVTPAAYRILHRGIKRTANLEYIAKVKKPRHHKQHENYHQLVSKKDWPAATAEVERLAEGNPAWRTSLLELGKQSVADLGLEKTLQWTGEISDQATRLDVEMGAIQGACDDGKTIPGYRDPSLPSTIATGLPWPSAGC